MPVTTDSPPTPSLKQHERLRRRVHPDCVVCSPDHQRGLRLAFEIADDGRFLARFDCARVFQGYPDRLQGGVIASLMDGVMTNCLFAHGVVAVTVDLSVRYRHPVTIDAPVELSAEIERTSSGVYYMRARLIQGDQVRAVAQGRFFEQADLHRGSE